jgi:HTH-type transcriptional regulator/antitoxin HigA
VSTIIGRKNPVSPETAIKLERVLGLKAEIWLGLQRDWDLFEARQQESVEAATLSSWLKMFPIKELKRMGHLPTANEPSVMVDHLLRLLSIGSPESYSARVAALAVHHRKAKAVATSQHHEVCWLMLGEHQARELNLPVFNRSAFIDAVNEIRSLTLMEPEFFEPRMKELCRQSGVALVFQKPISKTCIYGSARWIDDERPIIQMSLRMKSNDHFWWTFFHEAAHIVLHQGMSFVDDKHSAGDGVEAEADHWAEERLVGHLRIERFANERPRSKADVRKFAEEVQVHPGIIVGMLQHRQVIPYQNMNDLKVRFEWVDELPSENITQDC